MSDMLKEIIDDEYSGNPAHRAAVRLFELQVTEEMVLKRDDLPDDRRIPIANALRYFHEHMPKRAF